MTRKLPRLLIAPVLCFPMGTFALGIGQIEVNSALNQLLDAEIPLLSPEETELAGLSASLASSEIFAQYAIERPSLLAELEFSVRTTEDGRSFIKVTSKQPIREPVLNFLVQLEWPKGQLVREFTVLLDLPTTAVKHLTSPSGFFAEPPAAVSGSSAKVADGLVVHRGDTFYGPVARGEVLWHIAAKVRPDASISRQRMMHALLEANPGAFWKPHIDGVRAGAILRIPSAQEIEPARFSAEVSQQLANQQAGQLARVSDEQPGQGGSQETFQVKLVPPDVTAHAQPSSMYSEPAAATSQTVEPIAATVLPADFRIKLKDERPLLSIAGLEAVRSRISTLVQEDEESLTLEQAHESAAAAKLPPTTATNTPWQALESETAGDDNATVQPSVAEATTVEDELLFTTEPQQTSVDTAATSQPETAFPQAMADLPSALPDRATLFPEPARELQPEFVLPPASHSDSATSQQDKPESTTTAAKSDAAFEEIQHTTSEVVDASLVTQPTAVISPPESLPVTPAAARQPPPGILTVLLEDSARIAMIGLLLLLLGTVSYFVLRRAKRSEEKEALAFEAIIPDTEPAQESAITPSGAERSSATPSVKSAKSFRATPNPLERADLLLAVGNHAEAENLIRLALTEDSANPELRIKLLDIYFAVGNKERFLKEAEEQHRQLGGDKHSLWTYIARMGRQLYPNHALFKTTSSATSEKDSLSGKASSKDNPQAGAASSMDSQFADLDFNAFMHDDRAAEIPASETSDASTGLDGLDWELPDIEPPTVTSVQPPEDESNDKGKQEIEPRTVAHDLDWELPNGEPPTVTLETPRGDQQNNNQDALQTKPGNFVFNEVSAQAEEESDDPVSLRTVSSSYEADSATDQIAREKDNFEERLNNLDIELQRLEKDDLADAKNNAGVLGTEDYIETKLDLAMAYVEMGDPVGARNLLEEVLQEGNADQKQRAEAFIGKLG